MVKECLKALKKITNQIKQNSSVITNTDLAC